ncbi:MAG: N-acetyltransferase [Caldilineales bacterium]
MSLSIRAAAAGDITAICALINSFAARNLMLPRSETQVNAALPRFLIAEAEGELLGCGSLVDLAPDLAEIRSLAVAATAHGRGIGGDIVSALLEMARTLGTAQVCALTLRPNFFQRQGFHIVGRWTLTPKVWHECVYCPKFHRCDEVAMLLDLRDPAARGAPPPWWHSMADHAPQSVLRWLARNARER